MAKKDLVLSDPSQPVQWNIVVNTVHILGYKIWKQAPGNTDWELIKEGVSTDNIADNGEFSVEKGAKFSYWMGIGSTVPETEFEISVVLSQNGKVMENGLILEKGLTNEDGVARRLEKLKFV